MTGQESTPLPPPGELTSQADLSLPGSRVVRVNPADLSQHLPRLRNVVRRIVAEELPGLPVSVSHREVYVLADVEDWPNEAIGQRLNLKLAAVKSRLFRARKMMRDQLAPHVDAAESSPDTSAGEEAS